MTRFNKTLLTLVGIATLAISGVNTPKLAAANQYISEQGVINALNAVKAGHTSLVSLDQTHVANACQAARNNQHTDFSWAGSEIIAHSSTSVYDTPAENLVNIGWMDEESRGLEPGHKNSILGIYNDGSGETYRATKASVCIVDGANGGSGVAVEFFGMEDSEASAPVEAPAYQAPQVQAQAPAYQAPQAQEQVQAPAQPQDTQAQTPAQETPKQETPAPKASDLVRASKTDDKTIKNNLKEIANAKKTAVKELKNNKELPKNEVKRISTLISNSNSVKDLNKITKDLKNKQAESKRQAQMSKSIKVKLIMTLIFLTMFSGTLTYLYFNQEAY